jgi:uncharacterized membrane protein YphA (DoxX/SURF4 family)
MIGLKTRTMKTKMLAYWITTAILAFVLFSGGVGELTHSWGTLETVTILGYPEYFLTILGIWKLPGAIVILLPRLPRAKKWVYAGIFANMTVAAASHALVGDYGIYTYHLVVTLSLAVLAVASWALRPQSRILGDLNLGKFSLCQDSPTEYVTKLVLKLGSASTVFNCSSFSCGIINGSIFACFNAL